MNELIKIGLITDAPQQTGKKRNPARPDRFLEQFLGRYVTYLPVCPEVESGLVDIDQWFRLTGEPDSPRLVGARTGADCTDRLLDWSSQRVRELEGEELCGFIFRRNSPSGGMTRVPVYPADGGRALKQGVGFFSREFMTHFPRIPVEEDGRLHDMGLRENFIERIFTLKRWRKTVASGRTMGNLVDYHTRQKLLILAHSPKHYSLMGKLVAEGKAQPPDVLYQEYETLLMEAMRQSATVQKHANVLLHLLGYFKQQLAADEKQEMLEIIDRYRAGFVPLIVPVTLVNHYVRKYRQPYLQLQTYLRPHPVALKLRNHV